MLLTRLVIVAFGLFNLYAHAVVLPFSKAEIDLEALTDLGKLPLHDLIKYLREDEGIRVLVVERPGEGREVNRELNQESLKESKKALDYYSNVFKVSPQHGGGFLEPYHMIWTWEKEARRPYYRFPLIFLRNTLVKTQVIHEFVHYLVYEWENLPSVVFKGKKVSESSASRQQEREQLENLKKTQDAALKEPDKVSEEKAFCEAMLKHFPLLLKKIVLAYGHEIDVFWLMLKDRNRFPYQEGERNSDIRNLRAALKGMDTDIKQASREIKNLRLCETKAQARGENAAVEEIKAKLGEFTKDGIALNNLLHEYYNFYLTLNPADAD